MELIVALLIAGVVLLLLETILPGAVAGIAGFACLVAAVYISYDRFGLQTGNFVLLGVVFACALGAIGWVKFFPGSRFARPFISKRTIGNVGGERYDLLEKSGTAITNLRPSGTAIINGKRVDVVTEGSMIETGTPVKVVQVEGLRVVVRTLNVTEAKTNS